MLIYCDMFPNKLLGKKKEEKKKHECCMAKNCGFQRNLGKIYV